MDGDADFSSVLGGEGAILLHGAYLSRAAGSGKRGVRKLAADCKTRDGVIREWLAVDGDRFEWSDFCSVCDAHRTVWFVGVETDEQIARSISRADWVDGAYGKCGANLQFTACGRTGADRNSNGELRRGRRAEFVRAGDGIAACDGGDEFVLVSRVRSR